MALLMAIIVYYLPIKIFQKDRNVTIMAIVLMALQLAVFLP
jgi:hypothetical protein